MTDFDRDELELERRTDALFGRLVDETDQAVDPLAPGEIRRLGDRRRTRRRVGIAAGTLAVAGIVGATTLGLGGFREPTGPRIDTAASPSPSSRPSLTTSTPSRTPEASPSPSVTTTAIPTPRASMATSSGASPSPSASVSPADTPTPSAITSSSPAASSTPTGSKNAALTYSLLPTPAELGLDGYSIADQGTGNHASNLGYMFTFCQREADLHADSSVVRLYSASGANFGAMVLDYATAAQAEAQRSTIEGWYASCQPRMITNPGDKGTVGKAVSIPVSTGSTPSNATQRTLVSTHADGTVDVNRETVITVGKRLMWITSLTQNNPDDATTQLPTSATVQQLATHLQG